MTRLDTPYIEALGNTVTQFDSQVTIDVDTFNSVRSRGSYSQLSWVVHSLQNLLAGSVVKLTSLPISAEEVIIDSLLSFLSDSLPVGDKEYIQKNVSES